MPEDLASIMGGVPPQPAKKKLKKVGDHWEDENGVKYADPEGNTALKMEPKANELSDATNVQSAQDFGEMLRQNPGRTGSLMTGELNPPDRPSIMGGIGNPDLPVPKGMTPEEQARADEVYQSSPQQFGTPGLFYADWMKMDQETRDRMLARARKKKQGGGA